MKGNEKSARGVLIADFPGLDRKCNPPEGR